MEENHIRFKMNLLTMIKKEQISLTNKIFVNNKEEKYFVYWKMDGVKTIFSKGLIMLLNDENTEEYFKDAFYKKYNISIPNTDKYNYFINRKIRRTRKIYGKNQI